MRTWRCAFAGLMFVAMQIGCSGLEIEPPYRPTRTYPPLPRTTGHRLSKPYLCGEGPYYYDFDQEKWVYFNSKNELVVSNYQPPCAHLPERPSHPLGEFPQDSTRSELGLTPDENGRVAPLVAASDYAPDTPEQISLNDRLTVSICTDLNWELPFDTDAGLFESIGAGNIQCGMIEVVPDGMPSPIVVQLKQVTLNDAIEVLGRMGILELEAKDGDDTYVVALDDKVETYTAALVYKNGVLAHTIELRE